MEQEPHAGGGTVTLSAHTCPLCGVIVARTVPVWLDELSGPGSTVRLCPMHAAALVADDPRRRRLAVRALDELSEAMLRWPAIDGVTVSTEVDPRQVLLRVESEVAPPAEADEALRLVVRVPAPLMQCVTVAPDDDGRLAFWFVWAPSGEVKAPGPVLHLVGPIGDIKIATTKLGVLLALL